MSHDISYKNVELPSRDQGRALAQKHCALLQDPRVLPLATVSIYKFRDRLKIAVGGQSHFVQILQHELDAFIDDFKHSSEGGF